MATSMPQRGLQRRPGAFLQSDGSTLFRVWAPRPKQITLRLGNDACRDVALEDVGEGYFQATVEQAPEGTLYRYHLDDQVDRPDPASRLQPHGVHAASAVVGSDFAWSDAAWRGHAWQDFVIYEAHVGTFTPFGTLDAMIARLDDLRELGVTALQLMPVAQFPGERNWGYDGVHPFAVQNSYGGPRGLKRLIDACHARSLAVILDVVYNHLGPEGNYLREFGPYFTDRYRTPWGEAVNFAGPGSDAVRDFFLGNAVQWIEEFHVDGLRLDATHAIFDRSARPFLRQLADVAHAAAAQRGYPAYLIAENNANDPRIVRPSGQGGYGLDAQLLDDFQRSLHARLTGERSGFYADFGTTADFSRSLEQGFVLTGQYSQYRRCSWGAPARDVPADRFVAYAQSHDTIGNRPAGDRLGRLVDFETLKLAASAVLLAPSIPFLFMGEEYDELAPFHYFISHLDLALVESVRSGRQREFAAFHWRTLPPDPQSEATFAAARLNWALQKTGHHAVLRRFYQTLLRLRRAYPAILHADRHAARAEVFADDRVLISRRGEPDGEITICWNFGEVSLPIESGWLPTGSRLLLNSASDDWCWPAMQPMAVEGMAGNLAPRSCQIHTTQMAELTNQMGSDKLLGSR